MASILKSLTSKLSPVLCALSASGSSLTSVISRTFLTQSSNPQFLALAPPIASKSSLLQAPSPYSVPVRHRGARGSHGTKLWQMTRHWAIPIPTFYGPVRANLLTGESVGVRKVFTAFKRLDSGMWIQAMPARHKRQYLRSPVHRAAMRKHIMTTGSEGKRLDFMSRAHIRQKKYYVDDPYKPYQKRWGLDDMYYEQKEFYP